MEYPPSFVTNFILVCQLKKLLYGLRKAPRSWYEKIDWFFVNMAFKHCESIHSIYVLHFKGDTLIVSIYVDDLVLIGNKPDLIFRFKTRLVNTFEMTELGILLFFIGLQLFPLLDGLFISQYEYVLDLLKHFNMDTIRPMLLLFSGV
jgi:hypothetical protein